MVTVIDAAAKQLEGLAAHLAAQKKLDEDAKKAYMSQAETLYKEKKWNGLFEHFMADAAALFEAEAPSDIEGGVNILVMLVPQLEASTRAKALDDVCSVIKSSTETHQELRLKLLSNTYSMMPNDTELRCETFIHMLQYATAVPSLASPLVANLDSLSELASEWKSSPAMDLRLNLAACRMLQKLPNQSTAAYQFALKYLRLAAAGESAADEAELAVFAVTQAIGIPTLFQFEELLDLAPVTKLSSSHPELFSLLKIFVSEQLPAYREFHSKHGALMTKLGLNHENAVQKMGLLSLVSTASGQRSLPYSTIAKDLGIQDDQVESWVINAVAAKLLDARLNQLAQTVTISYCLQRNFTADQWSTIGQRLDEWHSNVSGILNTMEKATAPRAAGK